MAASIHSCLKALSTNARKMLLRRGATLDPMQIPDLWIYALSSQPTTVDWRKQDCDHCYQCTERVACTLSRLVFWAQVCPVKSFASTSVTAAFFTVITTWQYTVNWTVPRPSAQCGTLLVLLSILCPSGRTASISFSVKECHFCTFVAVRIMPWKGHYYALPLEFMAV